jgi:hypothetical protein
MTRAPIRNLRLLTLGRRRCRPVSAIRGSRAGFCYHSATTLLPLQPKLSDTRGTMAQVESLDSC